MKRTQLIQRIQTDPVYHITQLQGSDVWGVQRTIAKSVCLNKKTSVRSCNGAGKSYISARIALWFLTSFKDSIVITTAPTSRQVNDILWREIRTAYAKSRYDLGGSIYKTKIEVSDKWYAIGLSTDVPDKFQGYHAEYILIIVDEASGVNNEIFTAIDGNLTSSNSRLLLIGNPTSLSGEFYQSQRSETYEKMHISAFDTPNFTIFGITLDDIRNNTWEAKITSPIPYPNLVTPEWVYDKYLKWGEDSPMFQARVLGEFPSQGENTLIPLVKIEQAVNREIVIPKDALHTIGADIARYGDDKTAFLYKHGNMVAKIDQYQKFDTMAISQVLHIALGLNPFASAKIDSIGLGAGVYDRVCQLNPMKRDSIHAVNVAEEPSNKDMFLNLRAELYWEVRELFITDQISIPADDELMAQLSNIRYKFTSKGQIQIESKEEMKKRGLPSPDKADALMLTCYNKASKSGLLAFLKEQHGNR